MPFSSHNQRIAIVGVNREAISILSLLTGQEGVQIVRILNPEHEDLRELKRCENLTTIINATDDYSLLDELKQSGFSDVEIIGGLSARLLFLSHKKEHEGDFPNTDRQKILASLHEVKQAVLLSKNTEELLKLFLQVAISSCGADAGSIMLSDQRRKYLKIEIADGLAGDIIHSTVQRIGSGVAGKVARTGKPVLLTGPASQVDGGSARADIVSAICSPLIIKDEVVGVLNVSSKRAGRVFTPRDLQYLKELSEFTADVITTSKEYATSATSSSAMTFLHSLRQIFTMEYSFEERLNLVLMKIVNSVRGSVICNFYQYIEDSEMFLVQASSSFNIGLLKGKKIKLNPSIARKVLDADGPICLDATGNDPDGGRKWYCAQPILVKDRMVGLLFLHLISTKNEMTEEMVLLARVAEEITHELENNMEMKQLQIQATKISAVSEASFAIASARSLKELAEFALPNICLILEAEASLFWLLNPVTDKLEIFSDFAIDDRERLGRIEWLDSMMFEKLQPGNQSLCIEDLFARGLAPDPRHYPKSLLCKSFGSEDRPAARLSLYGKKSLDLYGSRSFTTHDQEVFLKFCLQFSKGLARLLPYFDEKKR